MGTKKISELIEIVELNNNDLMPVVDTTNEATKKISIENLRKNIAGKALYSDENGSNTTITLSENANTFDLIEIVYYIETESGRKIYNNSKGIPQKPIDLCINYIATSTIIQYAFKEVTASSTSLTFGYGGYVNFTSSGFRNANLSSSSVYVTKVIGYKA